MEHHCGIYCANDIYLNHDIIDGLRLLQHRGYEGAGVSYIKKGRMETYKKSGLVADVFKDFKFGSVVRSVVGHVRYSTTKKSSIQIMETELQPLIGKVKKANGESNHNFALVHNGNIPIAPKLKILFDIQSENNSDTLIVVKTLEKLYEIYGNWNDALIDFMNCVAGAFCFGILFENKIYILRDRFGIRPLIIGRSYSGGIHVTSESIAFKNNNVEIIREVEPGEIIVIEDHQFNTIYKYPKPKLNFCSFELIYFMNHETVHNNETVEKIRYDSGFKLGLDEREIVGNVVCCIPNSAKHGSRGFADAIGLPYEDLIVKRTNVQRTFILPTEKERVNACNNKFIFCDEIEGKDIYLIDDSIVRGTTMKSVVSKLYECGAKSIHIRVLSPPITHPCYFGIDMSTKEELIMNNRTIDEVRDHIGVESLRYLNVESMKSIFGENICTECFTGKYNRELMDW